MKILSAWIDDPTLRGQLHPASLIVEVTEKPGRTIGPDEFAGGWTVSKYGPFVLYHQQDEDPTAGDFNIRFRERFPVVVDVTLVDPDNEYIGFSLPLTRARQLVRKHDPSWRLLVNEREAEAGSLVWTPVQSSPTCRFWIKSYRHGGAVCGKSPAKLIRHSNIDFPMCEEHLQQHNQKQAERRTARTS